MYRNLIYFKDLHIISKVVSIVFGIWGIIFLHYLYLLAFISCLFFLFFRNTITFGLSIFGFITSFWFPISLVLMKSVVILAFVSLLLQTIHFSEIRSFLEYFFYRQKHSKIIFVSLYLCYFLKYYFLYFKEFYSLKKSYGKRFSVSFLGYVFMQSLDKTKSKITKVMLTYQYRFYNFKNHRSSIENTKMSDIDLKYISTVVMIFFMIYLYWR